MASTLTSYRPLEHLPPSGRPQERAFAPTSTMDPNPQLTTVGDGKPRSSLATTAGSSSLHHSASMPQLPALSSLASIAAGGDSHPLRQFTAGTSKGLNFATSSPSATSVGGAGLGNSPSACDKGRKEVPRQLAEWQSDFAPIRPQLALAYGSEPCHSFPPRLKRGSDLPIPTQDSNLSISYRTLHRIASMATMSNNDRDMAQPICQNCTTSTTPLWRRDEIGSVLCNACGLFLKLHGRPRPISLKTDVIKSRNRVKTSGPGQGQKKKSLFDASNGLGDARSQANTPPPTGLGGHRRTSHKSQNGHSDGSNSPISRTGTPSMYGNRMAPFNGTDLTDHQLHSPSLPQMHIRASSPGRSESSINGDRHLDVPQTYEQLLAANASLKTRVSELDLINELFRGRVTQLEQDEANARRGEEMKRDSERTLRQHLEESQRRENQLKRRLDDLEREVAEMNDGNEARHKKIRLDVGVEDSEVSTPASATT
ncbi:hypothetical protein V502_02656 [Pseudogymnoascus sp. VKM F-4520 (FW-2644)]|nr:hypothetical protein V502_02656 [Pseudogymnoascus sp. VKM F-4520 (FW-2644)]